MRRRDFIKQSGVALALASMAQRAGAQPQSVRASPRNLLFITVDDMDSSLPGFMGGKYHLTPRLDALAARSHRFVNNRTTAAICQPSREAMMTGLVPHRSGGLGFTPIHPGTPTLTTILKQQGYYTAAIHKTEHMQPPSCFPWDAPIAGKSRDPEEYAAGVRGCMAAAEKLHRPFFINCNIVDPHRPFYGSAEAADVDHAETGNYKVAHELGAEDVQAPDNLENVPGVRKEFSQYCNSAQRMDISIGRVLDVLEASSAKGKTIVFFSADHGMPFPFSKATVYDHGTRTPALLCWPDMGAPSTFTDGTCNVDYLPTLLELLGVAPPANLDGKAWGPIYRHEPHEPREYVVTHINTLSNHMAFPMRAIQNERFSLVFSPWSDGKLKLKSESMDGLSFNAMADAAATDPKIAARVAQYIIGVPLAFYDLQADPSQRINKINDAQHHAQVEKMKALLLAEMTRTRDPELANFQTLLAGGKPVVVQPTRKTTSVESAGA